MIIVSSSKIFHIWMIIVQQRAVQVLQVFAKWFASFCRHLAKMFFAGSVPTWKYPERLIKLANLYTSLCYNLWFLVSVVNVKGYACSYAFSI